MEGQTTITLLVDNRAGAGLLSEHGFSALVEQDGRRILYDTGEGGALGPNAAKIGIDLASVDTVVLSHGHYDHTGGLASFGSGRLTAELYFHPGILGPHFSVDWRGAREIGLPQEARRILERLPSERLHRVGEPRYLTESIGIGAPIERRTDFEDTGGPFFLDPRAETPDPIEEDLVLWVKTEAGLVVVVGCCHAGIVNTLEQVRRWTGESRVRAVLGGLHLLHASERRLERTIAALAEKVPERLFLCHCTGERATAAFGEAFGDRTTVGHSGAVFRF